MDRRMSIFESLKELLMKETLPFELALSQFTLSSLTEEFYKVIPEKIMLEFAWGMVKSNTLSLKE